MSPEIIKEQTAKMQEILGDENFAKVADSIAVISAANEESLTKIAGLETDKRNLEQDKADLVRANGALFKQIPMGETPPDDQGKAPEPVNPIDFHTFFNADGSFKK